MIARLLRFFAATLVRLLYRVRVYGVHNYHAAGPRVLIVANHASLLDGLLLYLFLPEAPTFAINCDMARRWYLRPLPLFVDLIMMDPLSPIALKSMIKLLRADRKAVIFPEGRITVTGSLMKVYDGPGMIADHAQAMVLPVGLEGPKYSPFSYLGNLVRRQRFPRVTIRILEPRRVSLPDDLQGPARRNAAAHEMTYIMREIAYENVFENTTVFEAVVGAMEQHGPARIIAEDSTGLALSFRQFIARSYILGSIIAKDTEPGEHVGLMLPSTVAAIVSLMAVLARGRIAAMLNFTAGTKGLVTACETAQLKTVYTSKAFVEAGGLEKEIDALREVTDVVFLEDVRPRVSLFRKLRGLVAGRFPRTAFAWHNPRRDPESTAIILFTSGSEGIPKGVALSHRNLLANRAQVQMLIDLTHHDIVLNVLPIFHAFGFLGGVLLPMLNGTKTYYYPSPLRYRLIPELCYQLGATVLFGTNTFLGGYARHAHPYDFYRMRYIIAGAERLTDETRRLWSDRFGIRVLEGYGATEASPVLAVNTPMGNHPGSVGQLLTKIDYYLEPINGIKEGGRLVVKGPNVMQGYLFHGGDGEIMPPWTERGKGWYDTGDIVVVDEARFVTILGRQKRFAKIGGEMVPLSLTEDIANLLWPDHNHAAVALPDAKKGEQIILATERAGTSRRELIAGARELKAPALAIPKNVVHLEQIPMLGSGKVDTLSLRDLIVDALEI